MLSRWPIRYKLTFALLLLLLTVLTLAVSGFQGAYAYRGLVKIQSNASGARNYSQCDSLLFGKESGAHTFPYIETKNNDAQVEHEATTSKVSDEQLFYLRQRGLSGPSPERLSLHSQRRPPPRHRFP